MTSIDQQGSSLGSSPTFPSPNLHFKPTFRSLTLCQILSGGRQRQITYTRNRIYKVLVWNLNIIDPALILEPVHVLICNCDHLLQPFYITLFNLDFNGISTCLGLFYAKMFGNLVLIYIVVLLFVKSFFFLQIILNIYLASDGTQTGTAALGHSRTGSNSSERVLHTPHIPRVGSLP